MNNFIYQWCYYYYYINTRKTKYGPLFTNFEECKNHLYYSKSNQLIGFIYEYQLNSFCYGKIIYKTHDTINIEEDTCIATEHDNDTEIIIR